MVSAKVSSSVSVDWKQEYKGSKEFSLLGDRQVIEIAVENALLKLHTYKHTDICLNIRYNLTYHI